MSSPPMSGSPRGESRSPERAADASESVADLRSTPDAHEIGPRLYALVAALGSGVLVQQPDGLFAVKTIDATAAALGALAPGVGAPGMRSLLLAAVDELNNSVQHDGPVTLVTP